MKALALVATKRGVRASGKSLPRCPRCGGNLFEDNDEDRGKEYCCLQCARHWPIEEIEGGW